MEEAAVGAWLGAVRGARARAIQPVRALHTFVADLALVALSSCAMLQFLLALAGNEPRRLTAPCVGIPETRARLLPLHW